MKQDDWKPLPVMLIRFIEDHREYEREESPIREEGYGEENCKCKEITAQSLPIKKVDSNKDSQQGDQDVQSEIMPQQLIWDL